MKRKIPAQTDDESSSFIRDISPYPRRDIFYYLKNNTLANIRDVILWADKNGFRTDVTMLDVRVSVGRVNSDKDFNTVFGLINVKAKLYFRIILRKNMNLFGYLYDKAVTGDLLQIAVRGIDIDRKEYFIFVYLNITLSVSIKIRV